MGETIKVEMGIEWVRRWLRGDEGHGLLFTAFEKALAEHDAEQIDLRCADLSQEEKELERKIGSE